MRLQTQEYKPMNNYKFSIGYNQEKSFLPLLKKYKENIDSVYFPAPQFLAKTGRYITQKDDYPDQVISLLSECRNSKISSLLLINAICDGQIGLTKNYTNKIIAFIRVLKPLGLTGVTLANPLHMLRIKKEFPDLVVESSVNCFVNTLEHAQYLKEYGVDVITIDRDINRNIKLIEKIKLLTGLKIKMILNEGCLKNCPLRMWHFNYLSHSDSHFADTIQQELLEKYCLKTYLKKPHLFLKTPFIPPDKLYRYRGVVDYFKLSTRALTTKKIEHCLISYCNQRFSGNLLDILDGPALSNLKFVNYGTLKKAGYFEKMLKCNDMCQQCNFCKRLAKKAIICA